MRKDLSILDNTTIKLERVVTYSTVNTAIVEAIIYMNVWSFSTESRSG